MWPGPHRSSPHTAHCCVARAPLLIAPHCPLLCGQGPTAHRPILPTAVWPGPHCSLPHNKAPATGLTSPCTRHGHDLHGGQVCCTPSGPSACCALPVSPPPPGFPGNLSPLPRPGSRPTFLDTPLWTELCLPACATREAQSAELSDHNACSKAHCTCHPHLQTGSGPLAHRVLNGLYIMNR